MVAKSHVWPKIGNHVGLGTDLERFGLLFEIEYLKIEINSTQKQTSIKTNIFTFYDSISTNSIIN